MGSELLTAGQALGKGSPSSPLGSTCPGHRKCCRSGGSCVLAGCLWLAQASSSANEHAQELHAQQGTALTGALPADPDKPFIGSAEL